MARPKVTGAMEVIVSEEGKPTLRQPSAGGARTGTIASSVIGLSCPDRAAAISMLPLPDDRISCDSCDKDIKHVSGPGGGGACRGLRGRASAVGVEAKHRRGSPG